MAEPQKSFPMLPVGNWWELRKKFKQSIPGIVTDSYLATVLSMRVESARGNVLPYLKQLGIIDEEGKTGERARLWRDDVHYPEVCKTMLNEIYPSELLHAVPDPNTDRERAKRWFANRTGTGEVAAKRMAALYALLAEADVSKRVEKEKKGGRRKTTEEQPSREQRAVVIARPAAGVPSASPASEQQDRGNDGSSQGYRQQPPGIYINLQVHISADATPDQIDQIFASMAKHIYPRG